MMETNNLYQQLEQSIEGEVLRDLASRRLYATDASIYQELPRAVVRPKNKQDCRTIVKFAHQHRMPLIPRAAGTSTAGQCVGNGMVVDVSRHMTQILSDITKNNTIRVQPGVILDDLNDSTAKKQLEFAHDISTSNRCMIGGMIGNNACGSHSILYGTTRDHVIDIETVLSDGTLTTFGPLDQNQLENKLKKPGLEGDIYRTVYNAIDGNQERIKTDYPKPEIIRRNTGYALDYLLANNQPWNQGGKPFNLAPLLCGSEGTLALLTEATLQLVPTPQHKLLVCAHFNDLSEAMQATVAMLPHKPAAIELIDRTILDCTKDNLKQRENRFWIQGEPRAILIIELFDDNRLKIEQRAKQLIQVLQQDNLGYAYPIVQGKQINNVWALRKAGFGLLMGKVSDKKAIAVIEDTAVAVPDLPAYVSQIQQIMAKHKTQCVYYGHASVGLLHLRPELDLRQPQDKKTFMRIADQVADLVAQFKGSLSGEHGDGRVRGPYVKKMLGEEVYKLLGQIKQTFDPNLIFNPNKILTEVPIDQNLRTDAIPQDISIQTQFDWQKDLGLKAAAEKCNGSGVCRKSVGRGTMCPSYMATKEEYYSTRGRANLLIQALNSANPIEEFASEELKKTLDLCLSCKACKSECPANVDMARLKSEFLHYYHKQKGMPLKTRLLSYYALMIRLGSHFPRLTNLFMKNKWLRKPLPFYPQRELPSISTQSLKKWWKKRESGIQNKTPKRVALLCDIFTQYHEPKIAQAAIQFLEYNGYQVTPLFLPQSPCLLISQGLLKQAKKALKQLCEQVEQCDDLLLQSSVSIIGLEPPEIMTLRDGAIDLVEAEQREKMRTLAERAQLFEEFILQEISKGNIDTTQLTPQEQDIVVHVHCHQKSLIGINSTINALKQLPGASVTALETGCCGMSGTFGYEHYDLSMKIGEMQLFPAIREVKDKATVVATGTSCRHQIADGVAVKALHPAQVFWNSVN
ncbi:MAG TPA: FAD-binding oxidoreductase [Thiotrichaceae bacterium]|nr:FAD-binding oxidoreductase [Thiotrichaceae bacterium]